MNASEAEVAFIQGRRLFQNLNSYGKPSVIIKALFFVAIDWNCLDGGAEFYLIILK